MIPAPGGAPHGAAQLQAQPQPLPALARRCELPKPAPGLLRYAIVLLLMSLRKENLPLPSPSRCQRLLLPGTVLGHGCRALCCFLLRAPHWDLGTPRVLGGN